jgi:hypothetical protein
VTEQLKPCAFCGSERLRVGDIFCDDDGDCPGVECLDCSAVARTEDWQRRADDTLRTQLEGQRKAAQDAMRELERVKRERDARIAAYEAIINDDGSLESHEEMLDVLRDMAHARTKLGRIAELEGLRSELIRLRDYMDAFQDSPPGIAIRNTLGRLLRTYLPTDEKEAPDAG